MLKALPTAALMSAEESVSDTTICAGCGLCCDGSLFSHVIVKEEDREAVVSAKLPISELENTPIFKLPCAKLKDGMCSVYAIRPTTCQRYRCKLRKAVDKGEVGEAEARLKIATAKEMARHLRQASGGARTPGERKSLTARLKDRFEGCGEEDRSERASLLLKLASFEYYVDRWFREER
jgi:Fe-S-cluster containining protein